jgi:hypothetical protein
MSAGSSRSILSSLTEAIEWTGNKGLCPACARWWNGAGSPHRLPEVRAVERPRPFRSGECGRVLRKRRHRRALCESVRMARAKPDEACRLAEVMTRLQLSTRDPQRAVRGLNGLWRAGP